MTIDLLLFASASDALGARSVRLELPEGATVGDLRVALSALPGAERIPARSMVARNRVYARDAELVRPGDEIALIPPVSGG